jgi:hypothetical protein
MALSSPYEASHLAKMALSGRKTTTPTAVEAPQGAHDGARSALKSAI